DVCRQVDAETLPRNRQKLQQANSYAGALIQINPLPPTLNHSIFCGSINKMLLCALFLCFGRTRRRRSLAPPEPFGASRPAWRACGGPANPFNATGVSGTVAHR